MRINKFHSKQDLASYLGFVTTRELDDWIYESPKWSSYFTAWLGRYTSIFNSGQGSHPRREQVWEHFLGLGGQLVDQCNQLIDAHQKWTVITAEDVQKAGLLVGHTALLNYIAIAKWLIPESKKVFPASSIEDGKFVYRSEDLNRVWELMYLLNKNSQAKEEKGKPTKKHPAKSRRTIPMTVLDASATVEKKQRSRAQVAVLPPEQTAAAAKPKLQPFQYFRTLLRTKDKDVPKGTLHRRTRAKQQKRIRNEPFPLKISEADRIQVLDEIALEALGNVKGAPDWLQDGEKMPVKANTPYFSNKTTVEGAQAREERLDISRAIADMDNAEDVNGASVSWILVQTEIRVLFFIASPC